MLSVTSSSEMVRLEQIISTANKEITQMCCLYLERNSSVCRSCCDSQFSWECIPCISNWFKRHLKHWLTATQHHIIYGVRVNGERTTGGKQRKSTDCGCCTTITCEEYVLSQTSLIVTCRWEFAMKWVRKMVTKFLLAKWGVNGRWFFRECDRRFDSKEHKVLSFPKIPQQRHAWLVTWTMISRDICWVKGPSWVKQVNKSGDNKKNWCQDEISQHSSQRASQGEERVLTTPVSVVVKIFLSYNTRQENTSTTSLVKKVSTYPIYMPDKKTARTSFQDIVKDSLRGLWEEQL